MSQPKRTFAVEREPESNRSEPTPIWGASNKPKAKFEKERAQRLPKVAAEALKGRVGADRRKGDAAREDRSDGSIDARLVTGVLIQSLGNRNARDARGKPGEFKRTITIRGPVESAAGRKVPRRGVVSAPSQVEVQWPPARRQFTPAGRALLERFLRLEAMEKGIGRGLTPAMAGEMVLGLAKSAAHALWRSAEDAGGAHRWFVGQAMSLIGGGKIPRGRETKPDCVATGFFMSMVGDALLVAVWLERIGYKVKLDKHDLEWSLRDQPAPMREGLEYLIQSRYLWELYP